MCFKAIVSLMDWLSQSLLGQVIAFLWLCVSRYRFVYRSLDFPFRSFALS